MVLSNEIPIMTFEDGYIWFLFLCSCDLHRRQNTHRIIMQFRSYLQEVYNYKTYKPNKTFRSITNIYASSMYLRG